MAEGDSPSPPSTIILRAPSKYAPASSPPSPSSFASPPLDWLHRTWTVTHSTLSMWRTARNVRITYSPLAPSPRPRVDDLVEYEKTSGKGGVKTVAGIDTASDGDGAGAAWDWRGKGLLGFVTSHWEILGWGERDGESWVVTWFAPTLFTKEGVDLYSNRREGMSEGLAGDILAALRKVDAPGVVDMVEKDMNPVEIKLPWKER